VQKGERQCCDEYHAYLLRLWRVQTIGHNWHALLQDVASGERYGFATMDGYPVL
jgi:hypothetical protein